MPITATLGSFHVACPRSLCSRCSRSPVAAASGCRGTQLLFPAFSRTHEGFKFRLHIPPDGLANHLPSSSRLLERHLQPCGFSLKGSLRRQPSSSPSTVPHGAHGAQITLLAIVSLPHNLGLGISLEYQRKDWRLATRTVRHLFPQDLGLYVTIIGCSLGKLSAWLQHPCRGNNGSDLPLLVRGVGCVRAKMLAYQRLPNV
jgi:hypothetical protein